MKRISSVFFLWVIASFCSPHAFAWGKEGHQIVSQIAFNNLMPKTKSTVLAYLYNNIDYLGEMDIYSASTWMDSMRSDPKYAYMKEWHYVNLEKGERYYPSDKPDIINALKTTIAQLAQKKKRKAQDIKMDLLILIHLLGDIHQPLHDGYGSDLGGNSVNVSFLNHPSNLHKVWDSEIIKYKKISVSDCNKWNAVVRKKLTKSNNADVMEWMYESRGLLPGVYNFKGSIDESYIKINAPIIEKQLLVAGLRLADLLELYFGENVSK